MVVLDACETNDPSLRWLPPCSPPRSCSAVSVRSRAAVLLSAATSDPVAASLLLECDDVGLASDAGRSVAAAPSGAGGVLGGLDMVGRRWRRRGRVTVEEGQGRVGRPVLIELAKPAEGVEHEPKPRGEVWGRVVGGRPRTTTGSD